MERAKDTSGNAHQRRNQQMLPHFRKRKYSRGILDGTNAVVRILSERAASLTYTPTPRSNLQVEPDLSTSESNNGSLFLTMLGWAIAAGAVYFGIRWYVRSRYRYCPYCHLAMTRLDLVSGNRYLDPGQRREASLGSVDYDVWHCAPCDKQILQPHPHRTSSFNNCDACNYRTLDSERQTIVYPTQFATGTEQITRSCSHCGFYKQETAILPMLPHHIHSYTQYSNYDSSSYSSSSYDSGGSSSSDSGSSGGGSSSGDGSSGSW
jgi:uncharacterized protein